MKVREIYVGNKTYFSQIFLHNLIYEKLGENLMWR